MVAGKERQQQLIQLVDRMKVAPEEEIYSLRAKLAQLIRELLDQVILFPNGGLSSSRSRPAIDAKLKAAGYSDADIVDYMVLQGAAEAEQKRSYFVVFRSGHFRGIVPSADDPALFKYIGTGSPAEADWVRDALQRSADAQRPKPKG